MEVLNRIDRTGLDSRERGCENREKARSLAEYLAIDVLPHVLRCALDFLIELVDERALVALGLLDERVGQLDGLVVVTNRDDRINLRLIASHRKGATISA